MVAKKKPASKTSKAAYEKADAALDKKMGIKENSPEDEEMDSKMYPKFKANGGKMPSSTSLISKGLKGKKK